MERNTEVGPARSFTWYLVAIFTVAIVLNFAWELAQAFLYVGMDYDSAMFVHCMRASIGDGFILLLIYFLGLFIFRTRRWFIRPSASRYAAMLVAGLSISIVVEWIGLDVLKRWAYTARMPIIPILNIGVVPVLQMLILPVIIFAIVARVERRS